MEGLLPPRRTSPLLRYGCGGHAISGIVCNRKFLGIIVDYQRVGLLLISDLLPTFAGASELGFLGLRDDRIAIYTNHKGHKGFHEAHKADGE